MTSFPEKTGGLVPAALKQTEISSFKRLWGVLGFKETHLQPLPYNASRETVVQTAKERLLTRLVAEQIWRIQGRIFSWAAAIAIAGGVVAGDSWLLSNRPMDFSPESFIPASKFELVIMVASKAAIAIGSGAIVYYLIAPKLSRSIELDELEKKAEGITERVFRREIPEGTPPDLDDGWRHGWLAADSRPRSAELSPYDLKHSEIRKRLKWWETAAVTVSIGRAAFQGSFRKEIINAIPRGKASLEVVQAAEFFAQEWDKIPADDKTKAGIEATARSWMNAIAAHPDLQKWMNTAPGSDTVDITTALQGARLAVNLPDYLYGSAGAAVVALLKARLYGKLKARAEGWQMNDVPVLIVMDEAQEIATREDAVMLAIGRSLGLGVVAATQTVEGVHARLHGFASKWLGIFSHAIALRGRSPDTDHWMSLRTGAIWQARSQMGNGLTLDQGIIHDSVTDLQAAALHQPEMNIQDMVWWLRTGGHSQRHTDEDAQFEKPIRQIEKDIMTGTSSSIGVMPIINQGELPELLAKPLTALVSVTRAGVERRDVITLKPVFPE
ncbi:hypothetical protein ABN584_27495 [Gloeocapsa sp. BRSZ]